MCAVLTNDTCKDRHSYRIRQRVQDRLYRDIADGRMEERSHLRKFYSLGSLFRYSRTNESLGILENLI